MKKTRLTVAQATITFLKNQYVRQDELEIPFFAGCFGIFGHGNVAGLGEALKQNPDFMYYQARNEQAMVHTAAAYAKMKNRLQTFVCTASIGPGSTNMVTAAAGATINRLPVLLLPGDFFSTRSANPLLQQLEHPHSHDISVNDCFKPISKYWDRINRPEQLISALMEAMRVLTSPAETGAVTIALPHDVQTEAYDFPSELFDKRIWQIARPIPDKDLVSKAVEVIKKAKKPMLVAGGGTIYSGAEPILQSLAEKCGIPVTETFAGKGTLHYNHSMNLGSIGGTGTKGANEIATEADVVISVGTRYGDFMSASKSAWQNKEVTFININIAEQDVFKHAAIPLQGDAKETLQILYANLIEYKTEKTYVDRVHQLHKEWDKIVSQAYEPIDVDNPVQAELIGVLNDFVDQNDVIVHAAGSLPGDLHKLWRTTNNKGFHSEYGNSCMGYEIPGGVGVKMADPEREVYVLCGDASYLMMPSEILTSIQEQYKITLILINNNGYASIGGLSKAVGGEEFGTKFNYRNPKTGQLDGDILTVDLAKNAESLGAIVYQPKSLEAFITALQNAKENTQTSVICVDTQSDRKLAGYAYSWWEVPVPEISAFSEVRKARDIYEQNKKRQRQYLKPNN
jgi:3D-(3,5/4)-trihydroxycyclohexane-1,2-dione acylhydrolase (decyclizing)